MGSARMRWAVARRKQRHVGSWNSDHVVVAMNRVMTGERRAWRKEVAASEDIGTVHSDG
jgi:hypothetical protein